MQNNDEWFEKQTKSMTKRFGLLAVFAMLLNIGAVAGIIYFAFWCLKHFGVIGGAQ